MFVKPAPSIDDPTALRRVRGPDAQLLPDAGREVPNTQFWQRRLVTGDVVLATPQAPSEGAKE